ncbi:hypothetical protein COL5a_008441 [Colletotrichum fioriniae]|uniref:uncharacterized protein n=1 Tax=Colletotrichum fioriniae TaxID=710243 RepID=UPI002300352E|nr:uncharacterized protein COL516b_002231 [Colletotrichum fioriniae]KAJ0310429.1 hypothetical protein COL516b_002231 [Colletotrichum fioriniae]KAJ0322995.1 hypothetical protein COL5a_008441 [Colletotrichum fioriniae]KAJ3939234.1 hypothetical protein N0V96_010680 [Colletotrichum fioriniae]
MFGRVLLTLDGIMLLFGAYMADWNETHIHNPRWPPHAKFHNAQTMTLSLMLGMATLFFTWRTNTSAEMAKESFRIAGFLGSIYWVAGWASLLYPGTSGLDPEHGGPGFPQKYPFTTAIGLAVTGMYLEGGI